MFKRLFQRKNMEPNDNNENKKLLSRERRKISDTDMIEEHLYISGSKTAENIKILEELNIKYVLSVFDDNLVNKSKDITYMKINASDYYMQDLLTHFPESNEFISKAVDSGQNVLVHCHAGMSRSATIVLAYIMYKHKIFYGAARALVVSKHSIYPNEGFIAQLELYGDMGFTLNANHPRLRHHLLATKLVEDMLWRSHLPNNIDDYFDRRDYIEGMTKNLDLGPKYLCVKCGLHLFNEIHIIRNNGRYVEVFDSRKSCQWTYIEPQKWMTKMRRPFEQMTDLEPNTLIQECPQCNEELIEVKCKFMQHWCDCGIHIGLLGKCLRFRIHNEKFKIEPKV